MSTIADGIVNAKDVKAAVKASIKDGSIPEISESEWIKADDQTLDKVAELSEKFFYEYSNGYEISGDLKNREMMTVRDDFINHGFRATEIIQFLYDNCDHSTGFTNILNKISGYGSTANLLVRRLVAVLIPVKFQRIQRNIFMYIHKSQLEILVSALEYRHFYLISKMLAAKAKLLPKFNDQIKSMMPNGDREYAFCCGFDELPAEDKAWQAAKKSKGKIAEDGKPVFTRSSDFSYGDGVIQYHGGKMPLKWFEVSSTI